MKFLPASLRLLPAKTRPLAGVCLFGLVAGGGAVAFQKGVAWVYHYSYELPAAAGGLGRFALLSLAVIVVSSLLVGWLLTRFCPEAAGSGIPQVKLAYWKESGAMPLRVAGVKFLAGVISLGGGQSLGREGPTVQIGSSLAANLAGVLGIPKSHRRAACAAGASAGLAAAFNSPLAAMAFVLEEIIGDLNSRALGGVLIAAVVGAFVVHAAVGPQPAFLLPPIEAPSWRAYLLMPLCAALATAAGLAFQRGTLRLRQSARSWRLPRMFHPLAAGLATWAVGVTVFAITGRLGIFSLGYGDLTAALTTGLVAQTVALLLGGTLVVTNLCYGLGGWGGIFSPNLFLGGMCGVLVGALGGPFLNLSDADRLLLAVGGMSACLGAVVQAPLTAILIIFEMTHQFALVPGLMLAVLVSIGLARLGGRPNFYEEILVQDGHRMEQVIPPRDLRSWQNLPLSAVANFHPVALESLAPEALRAALACHPYRRFPVVEAGEPKGVLLRREAEEALAAGREPRLEPAVMCAPEGSVRACQEAFAESASGLVLLTEHGAEGGRLLGVITLHDLLRTQTQMSDRDAE